MPEAGKGLRRFKAYKRLPGLKDALKNSRNGSKKERRLRPEISRPDRGVDVVSFTISRDISRPLPCSVFSALLKQIGIGNAATPRFRRKFKAPVARGRCVS